MIVEDPISHDDGSSQDSDDCLASGVALLGSEVPTKIPLATCSSPVEPIVCSQPLALPSDQLQDLALSSGCFN
ncbi:hypothetical protein SUGI_1131640 [Cryptomeria japonica]|nr:hypothetical protein SUGI_1131640 [Cryptomeria japonica]